jgi:Zn-dependent protease
MPDLADALVYYVVFLFSTTLHEAAHAWSGHRQGDSTAFHGGQVSLNPLPHIRREPIGMVLLPVVSAIASGWPIGFASAPYDPAWALRYPRRSALMSLAGPASNLLLVLISALLIRVGQVTGLLVAPEHIKFGHITATAAGAGWLESVAFLVGVVFSMNLLLATFNLLPVPPLDGGSVVPLFLSEENGRKYLQTLWRLRALGLLGLFLAWRVFGALFSKIFLPAVGLLYPGVTYQ